MVDYYVTRFSFNASHSVSGDVNRAHNHTFHLAVYIGNSKVSLTDAVNFNIAKAEGSVQAFLDKYSGVYLNDVDEMKEYGSDIEGLGKFFYESLKRLMKELDYEVYQVDISDNMMHTFQVSDSINLPVLSSEDSSINYDVILTQKDYMTKMNRRESHV